MELFPEMPCVSLSYTIPLPLPCPPSFPLIPYPPSLPLSTSSPCLPFPFPLPSPPLPSSPPLVLIWVVQWVLLFFFFLAYLTLNLAFWVCAEQWHTWASSMKWARVSESQSPKGRVTALSCYPQTSTLILFVVSRKKESPGMNRGLPCLDFPPMLLAAKEIGQLPLMTAFLVALL